MFGTALDSGKKVMLIMGTRTTSESNFEDYVNFVKNIYGDSYAYYYKGHPGTATGLDPDKQILLDGLGLIDVESSIAAELILFFYPDIYLSGYASTTFASVQDKEMACVLFKTPLSSAATNYKNLMDVFVTPTSGGKYLVEYNDSPTYTKKKWDPLSLSFLD